MKIPADAIIPKEKLTEYLLTQRRKNDKSGFLAQAGFMLENPDILDRALRKLIAEFDATSDRHNEYGTFFRVEGDLYGPHGILSVVTVWILLANDNRFRFVTLKPAR